MITTTPQCEVCHDRPAEGTTEATDASPSLHRCLRCAASTCGGFTRYPNPERERIRVELNRRRMAREAGALSDTQALERQQERDAAREVQRDGRITVADATERRRMRELSVARRRDELTRSLAYPMSSAEVVDACQHATLAARVPASAFDDVSQSLALELIRRHGTNPERANIGASWLRRRATAIYIDQQRQQERATGQRAAADQLADWREQDHRAAMAEAASGGDLVYALASNRPAVDMGKVRVEASQVARRLPGLTYLQRDAVRVALSPERNRPMSNRERQNYHAATAILRRRFHTADAVRVAVGSDANATRRLVDYVIRSRKGTLAEDHLGQHGAHGLVHRERVTDGVDHPTTATPWVATGRDLVAYLARVMRRNPA